MKGMEIAQQIARRKLKGIPGKERIEELFITDPVVEQLVTLYEDSCNIQGIDLRGFLEFNPEARDVINTSLESAKAKKDEEDRLENIWHYIRTQRLYQEKEDVIVDKKGIFDISGEPINMDEIIKATGCSNFNCLDYLVISLILGHRKIYVKESLMDENIRIIKEAFPDEIVII